MKSQIEFIDDDAVGQAVPYQTQLVVPKVDMIALSVVYAPSNGYVIHKMPIFAVRETITERWFKEGIEDPKDEPEYHNSTEFEEAGYQFRGRESDTEFLFIDSHQAVNCTDGNGIMKQHKHVNGDHTLPITEVEAFALCYKEQAKELVEALREEALAYYEELQGEDNHDE